MRKIKTLCLALLSACALMLCATSLSATSLQRNVTDDYSYALDPDTWPTEVVHVSYTLPERPVAQKNPDVAFTDFTDTFSEPERDYLPHSQLISGADSVRPIIAVLDRMPEPERPIAVIPEPGTFALLVCGLFGVPLFNRRKR